MTTAPRAPLTTRVPAGLGRRLDGLLGIGYAAILLGLSARHPPGPPFVVTVAGALALGLAVAGRRRHPIAALGVALVVLVGLRWPYEALGPMWLALFQVAATGRRWIGSAAVVAAVLAPAAVVSTPDRAALLGLLTGLVATVGYAMGRRRAYALELRQYQARQAEAELESARHGVAEERMRIARELHDVVAHSMSVITVQAGYGHLVIDRDPGQARAALGAIEVTGRQALTEMRRLLGVLRDDNHDPAAALAPAPGLADLGQLAARTAQAGVQVNLEVHGRARPLPAGVELSAYRIVQEALTNVLRHAGTSSSWVSIGYGEDQLSIVVTDHGRGRSGTAGTAGTGHGLQGMRERVQLYGGQLQAGPVAGRGFQVSASIPLADGRP